MGTIGLISLFQWQFLSPSNSPLYIHSILVEDLICHWHLSWVCILAIGDTTAVNAGVSVSFWMTIFRNIGPGVGVRILGLAVLKFFLLACGGCPFKGLFPMSVPRELERGSFILVHQFSSVAQLCLTLCDPMDCSTPGLPVHHQLPEFTQTHVH